MRAAVLAVALVLPSSCAHADAGGIFGIVAAAARLFHVPEQLMFGIVATESSFRPHVVSSAGAIGLGQVMPGTAHDLGCRGSLYDPHVNAKCSARFLSILLREHHGNWRMAAIHYTEGRYARRVSREGARYAALVLSRARIRRS